VADEPKKKFKYSFHLAAPAIKNFRDFLTENAQESALELPLRSTLPYQSALFVKPLSLNVPDWAKRLDRHFKVDETIKTASAAGLLMLRRDKRISLDARHWASAAHF
jgi:hypothetical protein